MNAASRSQHVGVGLGGAREGVGGVDHRAAAVLGGLDGRLAVAGEAVVRRVVHPDPQRQPVRREAAGSLGCEVRRLLQRRLQRQRRRRGRRAPRWSRRRRRRPRARRTIRSRPSVDHLDARRRRRSAPSTRVRSRAARPRTAAASVCISAVPRAGGHDRAALLEQPDRAVGQRELRPPRRRSRRTSSSSYGDADLGRARRCSRPSGSPASGGNRSSPPTEVTSCSPLTCLERAPSRRTPPGSVARTGRVVAVPQDPAGVVAGAAVVAELEPLEPEHPMPAPRQLHRPSALPSAPRPTTTYVVRAQSSAHGVSRGSSQRRMSALSSSIGANQPCV